MDRQCSSCGGFCKQSGCERENVATNDTSQERVDEIEKDRHEPVAWRFQSATGGWAYGKEPPIGSKYAVEPLYTHPPQRKPTTIYKDIKRYTERHEDYDGIITHQLLLERAKEEIEELRKYIEGEAI